MQRRWRSCAELIEEVLRVLWYRDGSAKSKPSSQQPNVSRRQRGSQLPEPWEDVEQHPPHCPATSRAGQWSNSPQGCAASNRARGPRRAGSPSTSILGSANGERGTEPPGREGRRLPAAVRAERSSASGVPRGAARRRQLRGPAGEMAGGHRWGGAEPAESTPGRRRVAPPRARPTRRLRRGVSSVR